MLRWSSRTVNESSTTSTFGMLGSAATGTLGGGAARFEDAAHEHRRVDEQRDPAVAEDRGAQVAGERREQRTEAT